MKKMSFAVAMRDYFGFHHGETLQGFMQELKALTAEDRVFFKQGLATVGYEIIE